MASAIDWEAEFLPSPCQNIACVPRARANISDWLPTSWQNAWALIGTSPCVTEASDRSSSEVFLLKLVLRPATWSNWPQLPKFHRRNFFLRPISTSEPTPSHQELSAGSIDSPESSIATPAHRSNNPVVQVAIGGLSENKTHTYINKIELFRD